MLRPVDGDRERAEVRSGGGAIILFGLVFAFFGLLPLALALGGLQPHDRQGNSASLIPLLLVGTLFSSVGIAIALGRKGVILDRRRGRVSTWWGLLVPWSRRETDLADYTQTTITKELRQSKNGSYTVYVVRLDGATVKAVKCKELRVYEAARRLAEEIAKFLTLPVHDSTTGALVVREAAYLDEPLFQRLRRTGATLAVPPPPASLRTKITQKDHAVSLEIPAPPFAALAGLVPLVVLLLPLVIFGVAFAEIFGRSQGALPAILIPGIMFGLFLLVGLSVMTTTLRKGRQRVRVVASPAGLRLMTHGLLRLTTVDIPNEELEELELPPSYPFAANVPAWAASVTQAHSHGIIARSDQRSLEFAAHLPPDEKAYLHALILQALLA